MKAVIYQPTKTAMQSGRAKLEWIFEFEAEKPYFVDPLMGWVGQPETVRELANRLSFPTLDAAVAYAQRLGVTYLVRQPKTRKIRPKTYADNFRFNKVS
jgi:hypothetical protein